ncbi:hypothetical protein JZ751_006615 [Albula glossodonta]|uniref:G protein-coupled receptor 137 n=1 Tax=Albula glossodonta TaxID=121402 RepID=A0A8T2P1K0_9TELE|nr:hypothetical protein JZ751_006615 [Albula glossodonta]
MDTPAALPLPTNSTPPSPSPLRPAVAPSVKQGVTILYTCLYGGLFLVVYVQLWLLLLYRHKRWSYQSVFLFLCLFWAALRTTLFSFYFHDALGANHLPMLAYWLLYCCPVCLQFFTLSLINLYFTQVLLKVRSKFSSEPSKGLCVARCAYAAMSALFLCVNLVCAILGQRGDGGEDQAWRLVLIRVLVNDLLFILEAVALAASLLLLTRLAPSTSPYLHSKGTTVCRTAVLGAGVILLFASRACYNLFVLVLSQSHRVESFDYDWYNISDQADLRSELGDRGYLAFGAILFIWELLPTGLLILIFRVRRPPQETVSTSPFSTPLLCSPLHSTSSCNAVINSHRTHRSYFFDDPRGMDSDLGVPWAHSAHPHNSETEPLLFTRNTDPTNQHHTLYSTPQN